MTVLDKIIRMPHQTEQRSTGGCFCNIGASRLIILIVVVQNDMSIG